MKGKTQRKKVTFEWNAEDVVDVIASRFRPGEDHYKWIDFPQANYASTGADLILKGGKQVGMSCSPATPSMKRCMLSLGIVENDINVGDVLTLVWGEPNGGSGKTSTERHKQKEIRVRVSPTPMQPKPVDNYADSWRTKKAF